MQREHLIHPFLLAFALSLPLLFLVSTAIVVIFFFPFFFRFFPVPFRVLFYIVAGTGKTSEKTEILSCRHEPPASVGLRVIGVVFQMARHLFFA